MKKIIIISLFMLSFQAWSCLLVVGELKINNDSLIINQKFNLDETYPYRTPHYLVHLRLLKEKNNTHQPIQIIVRRPKNLQILIDKKIELSSNKEVISEINDEHIKLNSKLKLKHI